MRVVKHLHAIVSILTLVPLCALACSSGDDSSSKASGDTNGTTTTSAGNGGDGTGGGAGVGGGGGGAPPASELATISGDATWDVTFDATAQAAGLKDCSYTRHYEGVEDRSAPWVCPSCEMIFKTKVEMTVGKEECFKTFNTDEPFPEEWIGYGNGVFYRGPALTTDQGTATVTMSDISFVNMVADLDVPAGGKMSFDVSGKFTTGKQEGDPLHGFVPPATYACGWPKADPPPYTGNYTIAKGSTLPDGVFFDSCGEPVRLHDFKGSYLFVEMSARDCPPCQQMASEEEAFIADLKAKGIDVYVITLLCPSLADTLGETTKAMIDQWKTKFSLTSPILADRAWGVAMFLPLEVIMPMDALSYPSWVLVDRDLKIMDWNAGYGGFAPIAAAIEADAQ